MKTILFDLDGTLIDSTEAILESFEVSFKKFDLESPNQERIKSLIGYPLDVMFKELGIEPEKIDDFINAYKEHYREISTLKTTLLPFATEAVKIASSFARLGIVTTKTARYSKELLEYMGIMDYFEVLIGREDVINPKPHPEPVLKAMELMNAQKNLTWMIGDTKLDILSANEAGINSVGVVCGYGEKSVLEKLTNNIAKNSYEAVLKISEK